MTEQQQVAVIRTMLYFIGKSQYAPTSAAVLAQLREATSSAALSGWDVKNSAAPSAPAPTNTWDVKSNKKV